MTIEATFIKPIEESQSKTQRLFKMSSPVSFTIDWDEDDNEVKETTEFVLVSRIFAFDHEDWETMIFPSDKDGNVNNWGDLWAIRGWEHIQTTVDSFVEALNEQENKNAKRLQTSSNFLD